MAVNMDDRMESLRTALKLTEAIIGNAGDKATVILSHPDTIGDCVESIYKKLNDIKDDMYHG